MVYTNDQKMACRLSSAVNVVERVQKNETKNFLPKKKKVSNDSCCIRSNEIIFLYNLGPRVGGWAGVQQKH